MPLTNKNKTANATTGACQTCKIPPACTLEAKIKFKEEEKIYRQDENFNVKFFHLIDLSNGANIFDDKHREEMSVPVEFTATAKKCISRNHNCPVGKVYAENFSGPIINFDNANAYKGRLAYLKKYEDLENEISPIDDLFDLLDTKVFSDNGCYQQRYRLILTECNGQPFYSIAPYDFQQYKKWFELNKEEIAESPEKIIYPVLSYASKLINPVDTFKDVLFKQGVRQLCSAKFIIAINRSVEANLKIKFSNKQEESDITTGQYIQKTAVNISGELISKIGTSEVSLKTEYELTQSYQQNVGDFNLLKKTNDLINFFVSSVSKSDKENDAFPILSFELIKPEMSVKGKNDLVLSKEKKLISRLTCDVGLDPMIGLKIQLDLLQSFISLFPARYGVTKAREVLAADEKKVKKGEDGAFLLAKINIVLELASKFTFSFKTDDTGDWGYVSPVLGFNVKVIGTASLESGARWNGISGFFNAEAAMSAKFYFELDEENNGKKGLRAIYYHDGLSAEVTTGYSVGVANDTPNDEGMNSENTTITPKSKPEKWVIIPKLKKADSTHIINFGD
ncbi:hypothetical protein [Morganella psychrotolerans]|uniref:Uncharacterized protein n=1 Tax=Morganella psychrotolerans TaxID=368603 RepID=A0A1B8HNW9_9GAMM|nr:hypothetical protein [Morganella psychrotolerans]OBU11186.1 hypothetical protein AYY17_00010 [Morganella psychrotolerans]